MSAVPLAIGGHRPPLQLSAYGAVSNWRCYYILANPVRAGLIGETDRWPFCGAVVPGYPQLHPLEADFWPLFWKLYFAARADDAGERKLPPRSS